MPHILKHDLLRKHVDLMQSIYSNNHLLWSYEHPKKNSFKDLFNAYKLSYCSGIHF